MKRALLDGDDQRVVDWGFRMERLVEALQPVIDAHFADFVQRMNDPAHPGITSECDYTTRLVRLEQKKNLVWETDWKIPGDAEPRVSATGRIVMGYRLLKHFHLVAESFIDDLLSTLMEKYNNDDTNWSRQRIAPLSATPSCFATIITVYSKKTTPF